MPFDLADPTLTRRQSRQDLSAPAPVKAGVAKDDPLDSDQALQTWERLLDCYVTELDRQAPNRQEAAVDEDF